MPKYVVLGCVKHNGAKLQAGDTLELTAKEAAPLLKLKAISKLQESPALGDKGNGTGAPDPAGKDGNAEATGKADAKPEPDKGGNTEATGKADPKPEPDKGGKGDQKPAPEKGGKKS